MSSEIEIINQPSSKVDDPEVAMAMADLEKLVREVYEPVTAVGVAVDTLNTSERYTPDPEAVKSLEELDCMYVVDQAYVLLASLGEKPATGVDLISQRWNDGEKPKTLSEEEFTQMVQVAKALGLHAYSTDSLVKRSSTEENQAYRSIAFSRSPDAVAALTYLSELPDSLFDASRPDAYQLFRSLGKVFGYPKTAIDAFTDHSGVSLEDIGEHDLAILAFGQFKFSREHNQDEREVVRRWAEAVKKVSPTIYNKMLEQTAQSLRSRGYDLTTSEL